MGTERKILLKSEEHVVKKTAYDMLDPKMGYILEYVLVLAKDVKKHRPTWLKNIK